MNLDKYEAQKKANRLRAIENGLLSLTEFARFSEEHDLKVKLSNLRKEIKAFREALEIAFGLESVTKKEGS